MKIELVCVGSELLTGKVNTNIAYIGERLNSIGLRLDCAATVSDEIELMKMTFDEIFAKADIVFVTGGLGPTFDDSTREVISKVLKKKLLFNREVMQQIARHFVNRGIEMPEGNERQAYIISGAQVITNNIGTAPGQLIEIKHRKVKSKKVIILLPGPPREMQPMFESVVLPYLKSRYGRRIIKSKILHVYGLSESKVDELIRPIVETERKLEQGHVTFSILAHRAIIDVKIEVEGGNELLIDGILRNIKTEIYEILGENIYGEDAQSLENITGELFIKARKTFSVAESCTGGMVCDRITNVSGSSVYFRQGVVVYSNQSKIDMLNVSPDTLEKYGAVSRETSLEMAKGVRNMAKSDYGLAITGIAGPTGATADKPVGLVYFGLVSPSDEIAREKKFSGKRLEIKGYAANYALDLLRRQLLKDLK